MRVYIVRETVIAEPCLSGQQVRNHKQYGPDIPAFRASGIKVVETGRVRTNQLYFKTNQPALAVCLFKLWPKLPKYAVVGYQRLQ